MEEALNGLVTEDDYQAILAAEHPVLPAGAVVQYVNEGAANIVYSLSVPASTAGEVTVPPDNNSNNFFHGMNSFWLSGPCLLSRFWFIS